MFSHYPDEYYAAIANLLPQLGTVQPANNGVSVKLARPLQGPQNPISVLRLRQPDLYRAQVGCADLDLNYTQVQALLSQKPNNLRLIPRPEYDMIEFFDPDLDVLAYALSHPES